MIKNNYHPEKYWSEVGERIKSRENGQNVVAGDDEPYYRYKRNQFLRLFNAIDYKNKSILEIGCGPGGNLLEVLKKNPSKLTGVDISKQMIELAKNKLPNNVDILKINGTSLPFKDKTFDYVYTATVLQHNTDEQMLKSIMNEISRVSADKVYLFERIESEIKGDELCFGRPISYYSDIMNENNFELKSVEFINIRVSYYVSGAIRKLLNPKNRLEGEPLNLISNIFQNISLPITNILDKIFKSDKDLARLEFIRKQ